MFVRHSNKNARMLQDRGYSDSCKVYRDTYRVKSIAIHPLVHENGGYWYVLADKGVQWRQ